MDTLQSVIKAVAGAVVLVFLFTTTAMLLTSISWVVGLTSGRARRTFRANPLNATSPRRWMLWVLGSLAAFVGVNLFAKNMLGPAFIVCLPGIALAQVAAFWIGSERGARTSHPAAAVPDVPRWGSGPIANMPNDPYLNSTPPAEPRTGLTQAEAIAQAQAEGYTPAQPTEDLGDPHEERTDRW